MRKAISVERQLAITLWFLATPAEYRTVSHLFGVARSTICEIVNNTYGRVVLFQLLTIHYHHVMSVALDVCDSIP